MKLKSLLEMAGVANLPKAKAMIALDEGFKEAQTEFAQASSYDQAQQAITQFRDLVNRNQVQGNERNIDFWRKQGWDAFSKFVADKSQQKSKTQEKRAKTSGNAITLKEDGRWLIVAPLDKEASCFHGKGSDWCTTKINQSHFESYFFNKMITLIYCIEKETGGMWAIAAHTSTDRIELFDKEDRAITEETFQQQTRFDPHELVRLAHRPGTIEILNASRDRYRQLMKEVDDTLEAGVTGRDPKLERTLLELMDGALSATYISRLYQANDKRPVEVPDRLIINASQAKAAVLQMVKNVSPQAIRTIVRDNPEAVTHLDSVPEQIELELLGKELRNYNLLRNPSTQASWVYLANVMNSVDMYLGDLSDQLRSMLTNATPEFQRMLIDRGSLAIRFVENPTDETKQSVMSDDRFATIRHKLETKWKIETSAIDLYKADAQAIEADTQTSEQIWNVIDNDTSKITQSTVDQLNRLADLYTDRSYRHYIKLKGASTANQHQDIINRLRQFTQTWDKKLDQYQNIVNQK